MTLKAKGKVKVIIILFLVNNNVIRTAGITVI
jgi:hypothetical protein